MKIRNLGYEINVLDQIKSHDEVRAYQKYKNEELEFTISSIESNYIDSVNAVFVKVFLDIPNHIKKNIGIEKRLIESLSFYELFARDQFEVNLPSFESYAKLFLKQNTEKIKNKDLSIKWLFWNKIQSTEELGFDKPQYFNTESYYLQRREFFISESAYIDKVTSLVSPKTKKTIIKSLNELYN
ncbi:MAG: hypothetical protein ACMXX7_00885 [Candidatus Woesearchaeota archaeon]